MSRVIISKSGKSLENTGNTRFQLKAPDIAGSALRGAERRVQRPEWFFDRTAGKSYLIVYTYAD